MVAANTTRSRAYLQAMVRHRLFPNYLLILGNTSDRSLPGQLTDSLDARPAAPSIDTDECWSEAHFDPTEPFDITLADASVVYEESTINDINDSAVVEVIRQRPEPVFIYSGYGGVLLRKEILGTGKRFLHVHGGYLPDYKGSTTNYYSLIMENALGASSLFLSKEIDSGPVLLRRTFPRPSEPQAIDHVYDSGARAKVLVETLEAYVRRGKWEFELAANTGGETYYIIHPLLKHIAILAQGEASR